MTDKNNRQGHIHLTQEELIGKLSPKIGKVSLDYQYYPGEDIYSDGAVEDEILAIVKTCSRVEFTRIIEEKGSWPILYHLSPLRGNIIDWIPMNQDTKVLEIGSGCGAITEKLAEKAGKVTCVDLSARRSHINAYRNQDRDNIEIFVGNFQEIEPELSKDYDYVCLIGVFEYGQAYINTQTPYEDFLKIIQKHVKNNGRIIIAIENKFGLKYWAGCKEDHLGTYFSGLEGYPEGGNTRTFTRKGLEKIFRSCGAEEFSFYYPYPDYKFPTTIYSDKRLPRQGELTDNTRNFDRDRMLLFHEKYVFDGITQDGLFDLFSNSYLAVLGGAIDASYVKYSNDRATEYAIRTEMIETIQGKRVRKSPMNLQAQEHIKKIEESYQKLLKRYKGSELFINQCILTEGEAYVEFPFEKGITLEEMLDSCLAHNDMEQFYKLFDRYYRLISYGEGTPATDYDLIFANIMVDDDKWTVIDYEWTLEEQISAREVAFRAIYCYVLAEEKRNKLNLDIIMDKLGITQQEAEEYRENERKFQKRVTGKRKSMGEIRAEIGTYSVDPKMLMDIHLQKILDRRIQIYFDNGNGFSEEESVYMPDVYAQEDTIEAEIQIDGNVKQLRIDPADRSCSVKIMELNLNNAPIPLNKKVFMTNGRAVKSGSYIFNTQDPSMTLKLSDLPMQGDNVVSVKLKIAPLSEEIAEDLWDAVKKLF